MPYVTENVRVNLVLPVEAEFKLEAIKFMENYARICMEKREKTFLMLVRSGDVTYTNSVLMYIWCQNFYKEEFSAESVLLLQANYL